MQCCCDINFCDINFLNAKNLNPDKEMKIVQIANSC